MLTFFVLLPLHVATLHKCLVVLLCCIHEGVVWGGRVNVSCTSSATCCSAAQMSALKRKKEKACEHAPMK